MQKQLVDIYVILLISAPTILAAVVSAAMACNLQGIGPDGWKRMAVMTKALVNFYILAFISTITGARYIEVLGEQMYIALLVASAAALGIKITSDIRSYHEGKPEGGQTGPHPPKDPNQGSIGN
jgi:hypothetical protein